MTTYRNPLTQWLTAAEVGDEAYGVKVLTIEPHGKTKTAITMRLIARPEEVWTTVYPFKRA